MPGKMLSSPTLLEGAFVTPGGRSSWCWAWQWAISKTSVTARCALALSAYPARYAAGNADEVISMGVLAQLWGLIIMYPWASYLMFVVCISFISSYLKGKYWGDPGAIHL